jgi:Insertion element 4 transposase N-terminal/Transposase DDE domain
MAVRDTNSAGERVRLTDRISIGVLSRVVPRDLVEEVVGYTRRKEKRSRLLPAHVVVYYVLALALFFGEAYEEVMRRLVGGLRFLKNWESTWKVPTTSAISQARARLGAAPLEELFHRVAVPVARPGTRGAWFRSWRVMAIDGVVLDVPDTPDNNAEFQHSTGGKGESAFPVVRVVGLGECGTHAIISAALGTWSTGEQTLVPQLLPDLEPDMLVLADRGFYSYKLYHAITDTGAQVVFRATSKLILPVLEVYPDGSYRSVILDPARQSPIRKRARKAGDHEHAVLAAEGTACRVVEYMIPNRGDDTETFCLITSILDYQDAPSYELAALYHERWEFELILDEIEIHQLGHGRVLRSKSPEMVKQEIWGILLTHYAIRHLMHEAADTADVDPDRLSFIRSLRLIRRQITGQADFPPSPTP